ncbi:hypothetical protein LEP1GSC126_0088 [Leptospira kirschneri str. 200801774]|nr:hypothetical protein LEP1GSC126_0088 [Leptospira kirschneri str. 200801774]
MFRDILFYVLFQGVGLLEVCGNFLSEETGGTGFLNLISVPWL